GKDSWPKTMDPQVVDEWIRVSDRDSFQTARRLAREEGLLAGGSSGTTVHAAIEIAKTLGPEARILAMLPDSGRSYLSKFLDDNWMLEHGFLERTAPTPTVSQLLHSKGIEEREVPALVTISAHQKVGEAIDTMQRYAARFRRAKADDVAVEIARLQAVQLDSIATVDRAHRLTLVSRIGAYDEGDVTSLLRDGRIFEYWAHEACLLPIEDYPLFKRRMLALRDHHWWGRERTAEGRK